MMEDMMGDHGEPPEEGATWVEDYERAGVHVSGYWRGRDGHKIYQVEESGPRSLGGGFDPGDSNVLRKKRPGERDWDRVNVRIENLIHKEGRLSKGDVEGLKDTTVQLIMSKRKINRGTYDNARVAYEIDPDSASMDEYVALSLYSHITAVKLAESKKLDKNKVGLLIHNGGDLAIEALASNPDLPDDCWEMVESQCSWNEGVCARLACNPSWPNANAAGRLYASGQWGEIPAMGVTLLERGDLDDDVKRGILKMNDQWNKDRRWYNG
jgi:hypothetical protein